MPHHSAYHQVRLHWIGKKLEKKLVRRFVLAFAVIEPVMTLPQIYQIWFKHEATGVSILTWIFYNIGSFIWLLYGLQLKDKPLIIANTLWFIFEAAVVVGVIIYG